MVQPEGILHGDNADRRASFDNMLHIVLNNHLPYVGATTGDRSILYVRGHQLINHVHRTRYRPHDRRCI